MPDREVHAIRDLIYTILNTQPKYHAITDKLQTMSI